MAAPFSIPFANNGEKVEIPSGLQTDGNVSFEEGFGNDYEKSLLNNIDAKNIERKKLNYLFNLLCLKINTLNTSLESLDAVLKDTTLPIGVPFPYPLATPPDSKHLKCNGAAFDTAVYTKLATMYPTGYLPDLRAYTIRGWDDGRGIDTNRELLSLQGDAIRNIIGAVANVATSAPNTYSRALYYSGNANSQWQQGTGLIQQLRNIVFDASREVPTAAENRVKNIAFNYIMRVV